MTPRRDEDLESVRRELREQLRGGTERVTLPAASARLLADELGRLAQSNDRLRRQNRRLRRRLELATGKAVPDPFELREGDEGAGPADPEAP